MWKIAYLNTLIQFGLMVTISPIQGGLVLTRGNVGNGCRQVKFHQGTKHSTKNYMYPFHNRVSKLTLLDS